MTHSVTLVNHGVSRPGAPPSASFEVADGETILDALLRAGVRVRYGCRRGKCGTCKHYVNDGDYDNSNASAYALLDAEREEGLTLLCQTYPLSDCTVELVEDEAGEAGVRTAAPRSVTATVRSCTALTASVWSLRLDLDGALHALPGQYVELAPPEGEGVTRTFSIASSPLEVRTLEVLVRAYPGGVFSGGLGALRPGAAIDVSGPYGAVFLRPSSRPAVLVGDEVGIGPLLSIVRYTKHQGWPAPVSVLHVAATEDDLVYRDELAGWASGAPSGDRADFTYHPAGGAAAGLNRAVAAQVSGDDVDVYVAGAPEFCDQAVFLLEARGVKSGQIYVERFFPAN